MLAAHVSTEEQQATLVDKERSLHQLCDTMYLHTCRTPRALPGRPSSPTDYVHEIIKHIKELEDQLKAWQMRYRELENERQNLQAPGGPGPDTLGLAFPSEDFLARVREAQARE